MKINFKVIKIVLSLVSILIYPTANADLVSSNDYVSPMNFMMAAFETYTNENNENVIVIKGSVLEYPESGSNFEQRRILAKFFELEQLNSLVLTFKEESCVTKESDFELISCNKDFNISRATIQGAVTGLEGKLKTVSVKKVTNDSLHVEIVNITRETATMNTKFLQINVQGFLSLDNTALLRLNLKKSGLMKRVDFSN